MPQRKRRILVVDDDAMMVGLYKRIFRPLKDEFDCLYAADGRAAAELLAAEDVDVVLLDWDLPAINGHQLLRVIKAYPRTRAVRVIMVSGRTQDTDRARAMEAGAEDYFSKPFDALALLARLRAG